MFMTACNEKPAIVQCKLQVCLGGWSVSDFKLPESCAPHTFSLHASSSNFICQCILQCMCLFFFANLVLCIDGCRLCASWTLGPSLWWLPVGLIGEQVCCWCNRACAAQQMRVASAALCRLTVYMTWLLNQARNA